MTLDSMKYYPVIIQTSMKYPGDLQVEEGRFRLLKRTDVRSVMFDFTMDFIDDVSLTPPHLTIRSTSNRRYKLSFEHAEDAKEVILALQASPAARAPSTRESSVSTSTSDPSAEQVEVSAAVASFRSQRSSANAALTATGLMAFVVGVLVTYTTYSRAAERGGFYVVAWGAIIFGFGMFVRGSYRWLRFNSVDAAAPSQPAQLASPQSTIASSEVGEAKRGHSGDA